MTELDIGAALAGRDALLRDACDRALGYLGTLADRRVAPDPAAVAALDGLDIALPPRGMPAPDVLRMLDETGSPATVASGGPRYLPAWPRPGTRCWPGTAGTPPGRAWSARRR